MPKSQDPKIGGILDGIEVMLRVWLRLDGRVVKRRNQGLEIKMIVVMKEWATNVLPSESEEQCSARVVEGVPEPQRTKSSLLNQSRRRACKQDRKRSLPKR